MSFSFNFVDMNSQITPHIPYEFTEEGMLQRVDVLLHKQNLCDKNAPSWPPLSAMSVKISGINQSCKEACHQSGNYKATESAFY